jgi:hypothetical protein
MSNIQKVIEESNKEFDEKFPRKNETDRDYYNPWIPDIKSFISQRDQKILSAIEEELEMMKPIIPTTGELELTSISLDVAIQSVKFHARNSTISDIQSLLKQAKNK